jgi:hypothetical protein
MRYNDTIKVGTLPNGLTIVTDELAHVNTNYAAIIVHTGGWHDPLDKPGLAHFSEHLIAHGFSDMTDVDFLERVNELVLLDYSLETGPEITTYRALGRQQDVQEYLGLIANSITNLTYKEDNFIKERDRIITEMTNNANSPGFEESALQGYALYGGNSTHSRASGGSPQGFRNITLSDIVNYHHQSHVGNNMTLLSTGNWSHDDALAWADKHLAHLDAGRRSPKLDSSFSPHDTILPNNDSTITELEISFPLPNQWNDHRAGFTVYLNSVAHDIKTVADKHGLYGLHGLRLQTGQNGARFIIKTSCFPSQVNDILSDTIDFFENSDDIFLNKFNETLRRSLKWQELYLDSQIRLEDRFENWRANLTIGTKSLFDYDDFIKEFSMIKPEQVLFDLKHALKQQPGTFYSGAITSELPTGIQIQKRDFSGQGKSRVSAVKFDLTPYR